VVGASGTGKSSLIRAGLIPRLHDGAIESSQKWRVVTCTPGAAGENPFLALAFELVHQLPTLAHKLPIEIATALARTPQRISDYATAPTGGAVLLFIDQLEELFTHAAATYRKAFGTLLAHAVAQPHLRVVATLRADFLPQGADIPDLAPLLQASAAIFPLFPPKPAALFDMIRKPAERAGLELEGVLAAEILRDAGTDAGALPLMAFCLEELYRRTAPDHRLTMDTYDALGRLRGVISRRAAVLLEELREAEDVDLDAALSKIFQDLVHVDAAGTATRRRAFQDELGDMPPIPQLLKALINGRLLAAEDADGRATVTLAHEALLLEWPALREWLDFHRSLLQRIQMLITALGDADINVRRGAAGALGQIGPAAASAVPKLISALGDAEAWVRAAAAGGLGNIGPAAASAVPKLITALGDTHIDVRRNATEALKQIGPAAVPALITALSDTNTDVCQNAVKALGQVGPAVAEVWPALITALGDVNKRVKRDATIALWSIKPGVEAVPALITALGDADTDVRVAAARALGSIGPAAASAVPELITALRWNKDWGPGGPCVDVRVAAAEALGSIGPAAASAIPMLNTARGDANVGVRKAAADALERIQSASPAANSD
jgi:HEAT repeat protein